MIKITIETTSNVINSNNGFEEKYSEKRSELF